MTNCDTLLNGLGESHLPSRHQYEEVVLIDPDGLNNFGHFLSLDRCIAQEAVARELGVSLLCHELCDEKYVDFDANMFPVFTSHSWDIGNSSTAPDHADLVKFRQELEAGMRAFQKRTPGRAVMYMYCGSLYHAEIILGVLDEFDNIDCCINLFFETFFDCQSPRFVTRWGGFLDAAVRNPRIKLLAPTCQYRDNLSRATGAVLDVSEHPSVTFNDREARTAVNASSNQVAKVPRIVFPGGMTEEKGFVLGVDTACRLAESATGAEIQVRSRPGGHVSSKVKEACDRLLAPRITVSDSDMSNAEFVNFIESADIIVLPYLPEGFAQRTSGLLIDALITGTPVVVIKGTWLGDFVDKTGIGISVEADADRIMDATLGLARNRDKHLSNMKKAQKEYFLLNSWEEMMTTILTPNKPEAQVQILETVHRYLEATPADNVLRERTNTANSITGVVLPGQENITVTSRHETLGAHEKIEALSRLLLSAQARASDLEERLSEKIEALSTRLVDSQARASDLEEKLTEKIEVANRHTQTEINKLSSETIGLDLVAVLRTMRSLWLDGDPIQRLGHEVDPQHGHTLMMALMLEQETLSKGSLSGTTLVEIGSMSERYTGEKSTRKLAMFSTFMDINFVTADADPKRTNAASTMLRFLNPSAQARNVKGADFLALHIGDIRFVYFDAIDFCHKNQHQVYKGKHRQSMERVETNEGLPEIHLRCAERVAQRIETGGIVVFDQTWINSSGGIEGEGRLAVPYLVDRGFQIAVSTKNAIALRAC